MANKQDARPFIDLQKDAEEFRSKFEEDIEKCKSILDAKITDLICDPDSLGNSRGLKQNALVEFSKAKYDIYISMKSLMNEMEREWLKYISEMKKLFIDNVEVFLANTKLEVKFPSTGSLLSPGPRKSFGSKSTDVTGSIYPIISNITKSIPGFTQKNKSYDLEMERKEADMASVYDNLKHKKNPSPLKQSSFRAPSNIADLSENDEEINESKQYVSEVSSRYGRKGRFADQRTKASEISAKDASSSESQEEASEYETESTYANSRKLNRSTSRSRNAAISEDRTNNSDESEEPMETETNNNKYNVSSKANKRKQASKTQTNSKIREEKVDSEPESEDFNGVSVMSETGRGKSAPVKKESTYANSRKLNRSTSRSRNAAISEDRTNNSDESEEPMETETNNNKYNVSSKANKRKQASKTQTNSKIREEKVDSEPESEDFNGVSVMSETGRGKSAPVKKESTYANSRKLNRSTSRSRNAAISEDRTNNSDESEEPMETETNNNKYNVSSKANKRKQASKTQTNSKIREEKVDSEPESEDFNGVSVMSETGRGKSAPVKKVSRRGRPSRRPVVNETVVEQDEELLAPQPSRSKSRRKTLLPTTKEVEFDEETSAPQPSRSVSRRKTLLPTAKEAASGSDIIPGNRASARSKRKTIVGVSDLATEAPSKRLKGSNIQKVITDEEDEDVATDVNLLENGSYSEWISLKSIDGKIPTSPGIYEVKVWRAKKSAYIGFCDSVRQKLTLHKLKQNSGHKHLDKFIDRNYEDIQIRYEVVSSVNDAKVEVKNRVNSFVAQHKTTPAYN